MDDGQQLLGDGVGDDAGRLLTFVRDEHRAKVLAERNVFVAAAQWAALHSADSITANDWITGGDTAIPIAGAGCPLIAEFAVPEFAMVIGRSHDSGRRLIGQAVEVQHRLPRLWAHVVAGRVEAWKAGIIADATMPLCPAAAGFVDAQVARFAASIGNTALGRLVDEAITRYDPVKAEHEAQAALDQRHVRLGFGDTGAGGTVAIDAILDYADAKDLEGAIRHEATQLAACGSTECLDVRRSQALGVIARHDLTLDYGTSEQVTVKPRQVVIHAHLAASAITGGSGADCDLARIDGHGFVTATQVKTWCGNSDTQVVVKPVIDTTDCISVDSYEIPDRLRAQIAERDPSCVFPWCQRTAARCDLDHVDEYARGGSTCSDNLAPLCRRHHRLKTHTSWTYDLYDTGSYLWTSPHGHRFRVTPSGTHLLSRERPDT